MFTKNLQLPILSETRLAAPATEPSKFVVYSIYEGCAFGASSLGCAMRTIDCQFFPRCEGGDLWEKIFFREGKWFALVKYPTKLYFDFGLRSHKVIFYDKKVPPYISGKYKVGPIFTYLQTTTKTVPTAIATAIITPITIPIFSFIVYFLHSF